MEENQNFAFEAEYEDEIGNVGPITIYLTLQEIKDALIKKGFKVVVA